MIVGVVGSRGFLGGHTVEAFKQRGIELVELPRIDLADDHPADLLETLSRIDVVINAAGAARPNAGWDDDLRVNSILPAVLLEFCNKAGVDRFVHVSSAAVQGSKPVLDERPEFLPFSPYSFSKALGEQHLLNAESPHTELVIFRPTSVLAGAKADKVKAGLGLLRSVRPAGGDAPLPLSSPQTTAESIVALALSPGAEGIFLQPWEGATTGWFWDKLGRTKPVPAPRIAVRSAVRAARTLGLPGSGRSVELLIEGQQINAERSNRLGIVTDLEVSLDRIGRQLGV